MNIDTAPLLRILLFHGKGFISAAIRAQTRSKYSHAAVQIVHQNCIIESWQGKGVQNAVIDNWEGITSFVVDVPYDSYKTLKFLGEQIGKPYDYRSVARFVTRRKSKQDDSWHCSELVFAAFQAGGVDLLRRTNASDVSPGMLALSPYLLETF